MSDLNQVPVRLRPALAAAVRRKQQRLAELLVKGELDLGDEPSCLAYLHRHAADRGADIDQHFDAALEIARAMKQGEAAA